MIPLPKPRGFWDYALFALIMSGMLLLLFWAEARDGISWVDGALALAAAVFFVLAIILARRGEKAKWISQPSPYTYSLMILGTVVMMFGAVYGDAYLLHRTDISSSRVWHDIVLAVVIVAVMLWSLRKRLRPSRQLP